MVSQYDKHAILHKRPCGPQIVSLCRTYSEKRSLPACMARIAFNASIESRIAVRTGHEVGQHAPSREADGAAVSDDDPARIAEQAVGGRQIGAPEAHDREGARVGWIRGNARDMQFEIGGGLGCGLGRGLWWGVGPPRTL